MDMFTILIVVKILQVYAYVKIYQIVNYVQFFACQFHLNKAVEKTMVYVGSDNKSKISVSIECSMLEKYVWPPFWRNLNTKLSLVFIRETMC